MASIDNKIVWITGASSGIGEALAYELAAKKCKLILSARNVEALALVKSKCDTEVVLLPFDLSDFDLAKTHVEKAISFFGKIDIGMRNERYDDIQ